MISKCLSHDIGDVFFFSFNAGNAEEVSISN